jgi:hypothetical protein
MKAVITLYSDQLMSLIQEKYPDLEFDFIWLDLIETKEHWEQVNRKKFSELREMPELKRKAIRVFKDGSFDEGTPLEV